MEKKENHKNEEEKHSDFWEEARGNVNKGAKIISKEAKYLGKRLAKYSETLFGKIKDNTQDVFQYGLDLTSEGVNKAQEMAEDLKDDFDIRKLTNQKKEVSTQLGIKFYLAVKNNQNKPPDDLMQDKEVLSLIKELEEIDKKILKRTENEKK